MSNKRACNARDLYIAKKLRERRTEIGLRQNDLAKILGIASQQIFKYENGIDRVPAGRLYDLSKLLSVPLTFFYEETAAEGSCELPKELAVTCANLHGKKVRLKFLQLKATLTDVQTQEDYNLEIS